MINQRDYVELGLGCADICKALEGGVDGKRLSDLSQSVCDAIDQLKMWVGSMMRVWMTYRHTLYCRTVAEIQKEVIKKIRRGTAPRLFHAKNDKEMIAGWKSDLNRTLHIFNVCFLGYVLLPLTTPLQTQLALNTHMMVSDLHNALPYQEGTSKHHSVSVTIPHQQQNTYHPLGSSQVSYLEYHGVYGLTFVQNSSRRITSLTTKGLLWT